MLRYYPILVSFPTEVRLSLSLKVISIYAKLLVQKVLSLGQWAHIYYYIVPQRGYSQIPRVALGAKCNSVISHIALDGLAFIVKKIRAYISEIKSLEGKFPGNSRNDIIFPWFPGKFSIQMTCSQIHLKICPVFQRVFLHGDTKLTYLQILSLIGNEHVNALWSSRHCLG
jgi:hypothetical protein